MTDDRSGRALVLPAVRRFWPFALLVAVVCALAATWAARAVGQTTYTAEGQYLVPVAPPAPAPLPGEPPPPPSALPETAYDAGVLARTYELVLLNDDRLRDALSAEVGISTRELTENTTVVNIPGTQVIRVTYTGAEAQEVEAFFTALSTLVAESSPTPFLPTGSLVPLRQPTDIEPNPGLADVAPWAGAVAGLLLGVGAAVLLERLDRRVRSAADVRWLVGWPVIEGSGAPALESVVLRLLRGRVTTRRVAVVAVHGTPAHAVSAMAVDLADAEARLRTAGLLPAGEPTVAWAAEGALAAEGVAERGAQASDATVVVVPRRSRMRAAAAGLQNLHDLGVADAVVVVTGRVRRGARSGTRPAVEAPPPPAGGEAAPASDRWPASSSPAT